MDEKADRIYRDAIVIDALNVSNWKSDAVFRSLNESGITAINATTAIWENYREEMDNISAWQKRFSEREEIVQIFSTADIKKAKKDRKVGLIIGWQNASPIENDLSRLELFHRLGVRIIQITYNERNLLGNGCYERGDSGLSHFGIDAVREMNRLGILIDLSHVGDQTTLDAVKASTKPVTCTHANARGFINNVRSKTDDALQLIREKGGVIGANAFPAFFPNTFDSTLPDFVDAIDDLVERIGIDHVGIGTDYTQDQPRSFFDWIFSQQGTKPAESPSLQYPDWVLHPKGMETPDKFSNVADELMKRRYSKKDMLKILGGNWMRLFKEVWGA